MLKLAFVLLLLWFLVFTAILCLTALFAADVPPYPYLSNTSHRFGFSDDLNTEYICDLRQLGHYKPGNYRYSYWWCVSAEITPLPTLAPYLYYQPTRSSDPRSGDQP